VQDGERDACEAILAEIFAALDKPFGDVQREAFWKGLAKMSIVELARCRDLLLDEWSKSDPPRRFGVGELWSAKRRLRAVAPTAKPIDDGWTGDDWDQKANLRLLSHILRACLARRSYSPPQTRVLVALKNRWAETMRASGEFSDVPLQDQDASWAECMRQAEAEIGRAKAA
jgi:hypothetical protein